MTPTIRIGQAAELLAVGVETLRRWELEGRLATTRTEGGQRRVPIAEVTRLLAERRRATRDRPIVAQSAPAWGTSPPAAVTPATTHPETASTIARPRCFRAA